MPIPPPNPHLDWNAALEFCEAENGTIAVFNNKEDYELLVEGILKNM